MIQEFVIIFRLKINIYILVCLVSALLRSVMQRQQNLCLIVVRVSATLISLNSTVRSGRLNEYEKYQSVAVYLSRATDYGHQKYPGNQERRTEPS